MSVRLTVFIRDTIRITAMKSLFEIREASLNKKLLKLGDDVWLDAFGKYSDALNLIPNSMLDINDNLQVQFEGVGYEHLSMSKEMPTNGWGGAAKVYTNTHKLTKRFIKLEVDADKIRKERSEMSGMISGILSSVTTIKRLHEVWPESVKYTESVAKVTSTAMIVSVTDINKKIAKAEKAEITAAQ